MSENEANIECRACLYSLSPSSCRNIFLPWCAPWSQFGSTIAYDLARVANIEISDTNHYVYMCEPCCLDLYKACEFIGIVQKNAEIIQQRMQNESSHTSGDIIQCQAEKIWPKPIQVEKSINSEMFRGSVEVEIKQEVLSEEDGSNVGLEGNRGNSEAVIKMESEEIVTTPAKIKGKGKAQTKLSNGDEKYEKEEYLEYPLKADPWSDAETETAGDLSLECLLCTKSFLSVSGLKAHVIAQHSYKSVKRKADTNSSPSPVKLAIKHVCATCRRTFTTPTDLMVHETCHNKSVCYGCNQKFDSFDLLRKHRKRCKAVKAQKPRTRTLEDAIRPPQKAPLKCTTCDETFSDVYYMNIHNEIHHNSQAKSDQINIETEETKRQNGDDSHNFQTMEGNNFENELLEHLLQHENINELSECANKNKTEIKKHDPPVNKENAKQNNEHKSKASERKNDEQNNVSGENLNKENRREETSIMTEVNKVPEKGEENMEVEKHDDETSCKDKDKNIEHKESEGYLESEETKESNQHKGTDQMQINIQEVFKEIEDNLLDVTKDKNHQLINIPDNVFEDTNYTQNVDTKVTNLEFSKDTKLEAMKDTQAEKVKDAQFEEIQVNALDVTDQPTEIQVTYEGIEEQIDQTKHLEKVKDGLDRNTNLDLIKGCDARLMQDNTNKEVLDIQIAELHVDLNVGSVQKIVCKEEETHTEMDVARELDAFMENEASVFEKTEGTIKKTEIELLATVLEDENL